MKLLLCLIILLMPWNSFADELKREIRFVAFNHDLDPALVLAIVEVESRFDKTAIGSRGEIGLFQLRQKFHGHKAFLFSVQNNIKVGVKYLVEMKIQCQKDYGKAWFICYNHGPSIRVKYPKKFPYYKKVMRAYEKYKT